MEYLQLSKVYVNNIHNKAGTHAMSIDSSGVVKETNKIMWQAHGSNNAYITLHNAVVAFNNVVLDTHNGFDAATYGYVAPVTGTYFVQAIVYIRIDNNEAVLIKPQVDGSDWQGYDGSLGGHPYVYDYYSGLTQSHTSLQFSTFIKLNAGEKLTWKGSGSGSEYYSGGRECWTFGYLVG